MSEINITENGVYKLLASLNPRKAPGPDGIPCRLVREVAEELAPAVTLLFVKSLNTGQVPYLWKHALVQPIFKIRETGTRPPTSAPSLSLASAVNCWSTL
ncbi:hypothetical protein HAZT_HAZT000547 [Hyalella azteca]|uniref:Reverse transcriptase domain-containing protein n=1 Tax=Hyalella azteca TaxID=294128 RepID=A0A6A0HC99_HYAAZ|nr:hypothetical protein HAZT_HAZT000547 [Hyalella azteca]